MDTSAMTVENNLMTYDGDKTFYRISIGYYIFQRILTYNENFYI